MRRSRKGRGCSEEEDALLEAVIAHPLSANTQSQLDKLREKSRHGTLDSEEQAELLALVQRVERQDLVRVEALIELAQKRGITVSELMRDLGIEPSYA